MTSALTGAEPRKGTAAAELAISVVIPTYNRAALVCRALDSVFAQTLRPAEIVVVDDGSTDDTVARLRAYGDKIRLIRQANAGGAKARNRGVELARCAWVAFLDSDDVWLEDHLERFARAVLATEGRASFYFRDVVREDGDGGELWAASGFAIDGDWQLAADASEWAMRSLQPMMLQAALFARARYLAVGGLDRRLVRRHDTHLFLKLALGGSACAVRGVGVRFTADDASGGRLTRRHDSTSVLFWRCTVVMYRDARRRARGVHRTEVERRLAVAHWRLFRLHSRRGAWPCAICSLLRSLGTAVPYRAALRFLGWRRR